MKTRPFPLHGWVGLLLIAIFWPVSWLQIQPMAAHYFFPLWLGYILTVDAWVFTRRGMSLLTRNQWGFASLFVVSAPIWWVFEFFNRFVGNWIYLGVEHYSPLRYTLFASLAFSTVVPAVFETTELIASSNFIHRFERRWCVPATPRVLIGAVMFGLLSFVAMVIWPRYAFPLAWTWVFFCLDPINYVLGWPSVTAWVSRGDWRPVIALWVATLTCGFFWEMWNFYAWPKWIYEIPFVEFLHVFEMPILGYGGYLPFGLEVFALYHFIGGLASLIRGRWVTPGRDRTDRAGRDVWYPQLELTN